ncbi:putative effector protein [Ceratobasidium theobromae]|uniref:Putative effector protein n=1 Tax=Ceratobasidium theobromae TaxID=1582974 RepID=A0A5N5QCL4_9AGAM|nr:putative effector protein [Ceratobasidium theobromae]
MHFNNLLAFASASLIALTGVQAADRFGDSCKDLRMISNNMLQANCRKRDGSYGITSLDLNKCVTNNGSFLQCQRNGNYATTCEYCSLVETAKTNLACRCSPGPRYTVLDLNKCVGNNNGQLTC